SSHAEVGIAIAESRQVRAILCEKPFTLTGNEAARFVAAAEANDTLVAEAYKFRHHPMHLKAKELVDEGAIGEVTNVRSTFCMAGNPADRQPGANWRWNKAKGGGSIYDLACYNIHHARWIFGGDPERVFSSGTFGPEVDDATFTQLVFPGGGVAQISVGWTSWDAHYADILGTGGMIHIDRVWNNENSPTALEVDTRSGVERIEFPPVFQFKNQLQHLCDCLTTGAPHRISPQNSVGQMRTIDAAFESIRTGHAVALA
ncbi:MAG: Gfo/Idh/MocA family oxidoreductase, partial [Candidatus Poribacteria bacterium]